jgi:hypothetical protein
VPTLSIPYPVGRRGARQRGYKNLKALSSLLRKGLFVFIFPFLDQTLIRT